MARFDDPEKIEKEWRELYDELASLGRRVAFLEGQLNPSPYVIMREREEAETKD